MKIPYEVTDGIHRVMDLGQCTPEQGLVAMAVYLMQQSSPGAVRMWMVDGSVDMARCNRILRNAGLEEVPEP